MKRIVFRVVPKGPKRWRIEGGPFLETEREHTTKSSAVGRAAAKGRELKAAGKLAQLMIHFSDGMFQRERTYGKDPHRTPG